MTQQTQNQNDSREDRIQFHMGNGMSRETAEQQADMEAPLGFSSSRPVHYKDWQGNAACGQVKADTVGYVMASDLQDVTCSCCKQSAAYLRTLAGIKRRAAKAYEMLAREREQQETLRSTSLIINPAMRRILHQQIEQAKQVD